jgi:16S rRNA (cytosine967-C5)-methyltransferase
LGFYQLRYQERIPASAAVNSTVQLAKENGFLGLTGFVNGVLRQYIRLAQGERRRSTGEAGEESVLVHSATDPLQLPDLSNNELI